MVSVYAQILSYIQESAKGSVFVSKDFLHIANRASIDKALSTLVSNGLLQRLARGMYYYPAYDSRLGTLPPNLEDILQGIQRQTGDVFQVDGAKAANMLGLSNQVPAKMVFLTNGYSRDVKVGNWIIHLKHASPKILAGAGHVAGVVLQALRYLGKQNLGPHVVKKISQLLTLEDKQQLKMLMPYAPGWAYSTLQRMMTTDDK